MRKLFSILIVLTLFGCSDSKKNDAEEKTTYKIHFDSTKVTEFTIEHSELTKSKALDKKLSDYTTEDLKNLPEFKRLTLGIVIPFDISKEGLINTMKYITSEKTKENKDIDEIMIFAYDDKNDLYNGSGFYTFGKLFWGPNGKTGNVTPKIAKNNIRDNYKFEIDIKDKVGKIKATDLPTQWELDIYDSIMADENIGIDEDKLNKMIMKKFGIETEEELNAIWLKVASYKN